MKKNRFNKLINTTCLCFFMPSMSIVSCSKNIDHVICSNKHKMTFTKATYYLELDSDNYKQEDIKIEIFGGDTNLLQILDIKLEKNVAKFVISPKTIPTNEKSYIFNILVEAPKWQNKINNFVLKYSFVDSKIKHHDNNGWQKTIEYIANCKHPTIYWNSGTPLGIQEIANLYLSSSFLAQELGHTYQNPEYKHNDNIYLARYDWQYHYKTDTPIGQFKYNYRTLLNSELGLKDIIKDGVDNANNMIVSNLQDFNTELDDYDETRDDFAILTDYSGFKTEEIVIGVERIFDKIFSLYPKDMKFNFVFVEADIRFMNENKFKYSHIVDIMTKIFQKADKIFFVSEGSGWYGGIYSFKNNFLNNKYTTYLEKRQLWDLIHNLSFEKAKEIVKNVDVIYEWSNCDEFIQYLCAGDDAALAKEFQNEESLLIRDTMIKPSYTWFSILSYSKLFDNGVSSAYFKNYQKSFLSFYDFYSQEKTQKFDDYIYDTVDLPNNFDANKKNLIILLPTFMGTGDISEAQVAFDELKEMINKIKQIYSFNNWNYIYKFHPRAEEEKILTALKLLFDGQLPNNSVVLYNKYPFEYLLTLDDFLVRSGIETCYHLIDPLTLDQDKPSGIFTGESIVSTSIYNAMEMIAKETHPSIEWNKINKLIQTDAWYIPTKHQLGSTKVGDYKVANQDWIIRFWNKFYEMGQFINPNLFSFLN